MGKLLAIVAVLPLLVPALSIPRSSPRVEFEPSVNSSEDAVRPSNAVFYPPLDWAPPLKRALVPPRIRLSSLGTRFSLHRMTAQPTRGPLASTQLGLIRTLLRPIL